MGHTRDKNKSPQHGPALAEGTGAPSQCLARLGTTSLGSGSCVAWEHGYAGQGKNAPGPGFLNHINIHSLITLYITQVVTEKMLLNSNNIYCDFSIVRFLCLQCSK